VAITTLLEKDLEMVKLRLIECREPRGQDVWLHSLLNVARAINPYLPAGEASAVWARITGAPCHASLLAFQQRWIALFAAIGARDATRIGELAGQLLDTQPDLTRDAREFLVIAGMTGRIASGDAAGAKAIWEAQESQLRAAGKPVLRLLRCHAERPAGGAGCAAAFAAYGD
jgi:hypothetical protein